MVDNVSFNGSYNPNVYNKDLDRVAKYVLGTNLVAEQSNPFDGMGMMLGITGAMEGFKVGKWALDAKKKGNLSQAWQQEMDTFKKGAGETKDLFSNPNVTKSDALKTVWSNYSRKLINEAIPDAEKMEQLTKSGQNGQEAVKLYQSAKEAAEKASKMNPAEAKELLKTADESLAKANALAHGQIKAKGFGKIIEILGKFTGVSKASEAIKDFATQSPLVAKMLKYGKGNGLFVGITGAMELFTQVMPAFGLGIDKGISQLVKSTVKTAASVGGWSAGAALGGAIGTMICPGAGSLVGGAIGALLGVVGGSIGAWAAEKVAEDITGKSELDIAKEKEAAQLAKSPTVLIAKAKEKIQAEGVDSEDAKIAFQSLKRLANATPGSEVTTTSPSDSNGQNIYSTEYNQLGFAPKTSFGQDDRTKDFMALASGIEQ